MKSKTLFILFSISWIIPIAVLLSFIFNQYQNAYIDRTESEVMNAVNVSGVLIKNHIDEAASRIYRQSSDEEWRSNYRKLQTGQLSTEEYLTWIRLQVISKFSPDEQFAFTAFYLINQDEPQVYTAKSDFEYDDYMENVDGYLKPLIRNKEKQAQVAIVGNQIYLIQNLFFSIYDISYGAMVIRLERDKVFKDIPLEEFENIFVEVNKTGYYLTYFEETTMPDSKMNVLSDLRNGSAENNERGIRRTFQKGYTGYRYNVIENNYSLDFYYLKDMGDLYYEIFRVNLIVIISVLAMIPIMVMTYYYMQKNSKYLQRMATKDAQIAALQA